MVNIPYFQFTTVYLGPIPIKVWGLFVALGIVVSFFILQRQCKKEDTKYRELVERIFFVVVISGFIGARLGHVLWYEWAYYSQHLAQIFALWRGGWSSYGGFMGAAIALIYFQMKYKGVDWKKLYDRCAYAFVWGWFVGRLGCFLIHDHPGRPCHGCLLGVEYPDGTVRADLGLYDGLLALFIGVILVVGKKIGWFKKTGSMVTTLILGYTIPRFFLDFLRAAPSDLTPGDARYFGLTPAQYISVAMVLVIAYFLILKKKRA
ncbi:MAG TPA: hypothetical protein DDW36_02165 [Candidatus Magasanikbacteria bacterium]|nr:hypothetical protein [Candidatus Magasanikbacteria bacterium]